MIKIAVIGAGSVGFTRQLFRDVLTVPELRETHFALTDINRQNLELIEQLCRKDLKNNALPAKVTTSTDRRQTLDGADYVISVVRVGGLEAFAHDIEIPLKYGIDQCVGDTLCAGGIMYGQRNVPVILDFCKDIRELAKPDVLFMNFANPNAMNTWAALEYGGVNTIGLCHGVYHGHSQIAEVLGASNRDEVETICAGINHQTWYTQIIYKGRHISGQELLEAFERHPVYSNTEKVRIDILRRFGYFSTESNGHLSEYVPWYRKRPGQIRKWIDLSTWINGETGGYLRFCREHRNWFRTDFKKWLEAEDPAIGAMSRGPEHFSYIIEALETGRHYRGCFNVRNQGTITNLPDDCVVEVPCYVDRNGISVPRVGELPLACASTCTASINVQRMAVEAAVHGNLMLLKQAMLHDPLTAAICDPDEIWQMTDEMLVAQAQWLPQYRDEIPKAKVRLRHSTIKTRNWKGAARLREKSVEEIRAQTGRIAAGAESADAAVRIGTQRKIKKK